MDAGRKVRNRLEGLGTKGLACSICLPALLVLLCTAIAQTGPNVLIVRKAGLNAVDVDFSSETFTRCGVNYDGTTLPQQIPRCWNHVFNFNSRWALAGHGGGRARDPTMRAHTRRGGGGWRRQAGTRTTPPRLRPALVLTHCWYPSSGADGRSTLTFSSGSGLPSQVR